MGKSQISGNKKNFRIGKLIFNYQKIKVTH